MPDSFCAAIIGKRNSGKTYLLREILKSEAWDPYNFHVIIIVSPTLHLQTEFWDGINPRGVLFVPSLNNGILEAIINERAKAKKRLLFPIDSDDESGLDSDSDDELAPKDRFYHCLVITDDIGYETRVNADSKKGSVLDKLSFKGRHHRISSIQLCQKWTQMTPGYRSQLDWFLWAGSSNKHEVTCVYKEFSDEDNIKEYRQELKKIFNTNYAWLYVENTKGRLHTEKL